MIMIKIVQNHTINIIVSFFPFFKFSLVVTFHHPVSWHDRIDVSQ